MENQPHTDLNPDEFAKGVQAHPDAVLLDVRTPEEFDSGHLPGALNINIMGYDFEEQIDALDPAKAYYVYCKAGSRSSSAIRMMKSKGFRELYNLQGGIMAWNGAVEM